MRDKIFVRKPSMRSDVPPFHAMDIMNEAIELERGGNRVIHLEVGQPGAAAPGPVLETARKLMSTGQFRYTEAVGRLQLRKKISEYYHNFHNLEIDPDRIIITTGSSAGFNLVFLACFDTGDRVALARPGYPPYRNILSSLGLDAVEIDTGPATRWALTPELIAGHESKGRIAGVLTASPANPTGTMLDNESLGNLCESCDDQKQWFISDEIYHRLVYHGEAETALKYSDNAIVINSFSKYYCMTGWRIGWMVVPLELVRSIERLAQNIYISAPELSQLAACAAFDSTSELEAIKSSYASNRQQLLQRLEKIGFDEILPVDGAFYIYAGIRNFSNDSMDFATRMLREAHVAATPGVDFDRVNGSNFIRFSFAGPESDIKEALDQLQHWLK